jgi:hypothetical protein
MVIYLDYVDWGTNIVTKRAREALVLSVIFGSLSFLRISALRTLRLRPALCDTRLKVGKSMYDSNGNVIVSFCSVVPIQSIVDELRAGPM